MLNIIFIDQRKKAKKCKNAFYVSTNKIKLYILTQLKDL